MTSAERRFGVLRCRVGTCAVLQGPVGDVAVPHRGTPVERGLGDQLEGDVPVAQPRQPVLEHRLTPVEIYKG